MARDGKITVVSRAPLRMSGTEAVRRDWRTLVEVTAPALHPKPPRSLSDAVLVVLPPVLAGSLTATFAPLEAAIAIGGAVFFAASYLAPVLRRRAVEYPASRRAVEHPASRRAEQRPASRRAEVRTLSASPERAAFQQAIETADRISGTWPALGSLIDVAEAEEMLAEALWEISGVLTRRQELTAVLAELNRPDFAAVSPADQTMRELRAQLQATRTALTQVNTDLARREAGLRRAEEAGRHFIREQDMRRAIQAAEDSLSAAPPPDFPKPTLDAAADLAERTQSVLTAYRELTAGLQLHQPLR